MGARRASAPPGMCPNLTVNGKKQTGSYSTNASPFLIGRYDRNEMYTVDTVFSPNDTIFNKNQPPQ